MINLVQSHRESGYNLTRFGNILDGKRTHKYKIVNT